MSTQPSRTRLVDNLVAAEIGAQQLLSTTIPNKASTTNVALLFQQQNENENQNEENLPIIGSFPKNGNVSDISLLSAIYNNKKLLNNEATTSILHQLITKVQKENTSVFHTPEIKNLFPIAESNPCTNFGSFGCPPLPVTLCQSLYQNIIMDSDADNFLRVEVFKRLRDVRRALADYIKLENEDEIFLTDNAGEAMNVALSSLMFNPSFLHYQIKKKLERLANDNDTKKNKKKIFKILMLCNAYPMVQECVDFHMNRLHALNRFSSAFGEENEKQQELPYSIEVVKMPLTKAMVNSLKEIPINPKTNYYDFSSFASGKEEENSPLFISQIVNEVLSGDYSCLILDHVMFSPSLITPIDEISRRIKSVAPETLIIVDGAHSIGSVRLDFSNNGAVMSHSSFNTPLERHLTVDVFLSNCHKWLCAPKSSAILYCKQELHPFLHPSVISNMHRGDDEAVKMTENSSSSTSDQQKITRGGNFVFATDKTSSERLHTEFVWKGTRDPSNFLSIVDLLWLRYQLSPSPSSNGNHQDDTAWIESNRKLALQGAKKMAEIWSKNDSNVEVVLDGCPGALSSMVTVRFPSTDKKVVNKAIEYTMIHHTNFLATAYVEGLDVPYARVGAQVYSKLEDFEFAAEKFLEALEIVSKE